MVQVSELMSSNVLTVRDDVPLRQAATEMRLAHVRHMPVVNAKGRLVGMLSSLDVASTRRKAPGVDYLVAEVMSSRPVTVREDDEAHEAARLLRTRRIGALPVVREDGSLVGVVTESDFLEVAELALKGKPLRLAR